MSYSVYANLYQLFIQFPVRLSVPFFPFKRIKSTKPTNNQPDNCQLCRFICWLNRSLKKLSEKRSYYSDTPGKFVLLKELKRKFLQIFFVDNFYFCSFVAENERLNQRKIIPSVFATFLSVLSLFLSWPCLFPYSGCGISRTYPARCRNACIYR